MTTENTRHGGWASFGLAILALAILIGNGFVAAVAISQDGADIVGVEQSVTHAVQRLALGHPLYSDPEKPPFAMIQYTPFHYQASAAIVRTLGIDPHDPAATTNVGRTVSACLWLATIALVFVWLVRMDAGFAIALALVAWWTTQSGVWWFLNRPDSAESLLHFVVLAMATRSVGSERTSLGWVVATGLASAAVGLAKQNGWFLGVAFVVFLFVTGRRPAAFVAFASLAVGHLVLHFLAWRVWGEAWPRNIFGALDNGLSLDRAVILAYQPIAFQAAAIVAVAFSLSWRWRKRSEGGRQWLAFAFAASFAFAAVTAFKIGSADNYFIDAFGIASLLMGRAVADLDRNRALPLHAVAIAFLALYAPFKILESKRIADSAPTYSSLRPLADRVVKLLADKPNAWAFIHDSPASCFLPERTLAPQFLLAHIAYQRAKFSFDAFAKLVARGEVAVVVFRQKLSSQPGDRPKILGASLEEFTFVETVGQWHVYLHDRYPPPAAR